MRASRRQNHPEVVGDATDLESVMEKARDKLVAWLARKFFKEREDAEDRAQDAMAKAFRLRHKYDPTKGRAETWLFQVAKRMVLDEFRKRQPTQLVSLDSLHEWELPALEGPAEAYEREAQKTRLYRALRRLPKGQRFPVILRCLQGYTYPRVAARLGITVEQARHGVRKGLAALRTILRE